MQDTQYKNILIGLALFLFVVLMGIVVTFFYLTKPARQVACTAEAKICPDGSGVGRVAPDCEFAPCPKSWQNLSVDYKNGTYLIEGESVTLANGYAETQVAPDSASKKITRYFGNEATGDLDGNGLPDVAFVFTQTGGGSGTFYYAVVALKNGNGYQGTNAIFLGDRIAPQTTEIKNGELIVNYAQRKTGEAMITPPSVGVSKYIKVVGNELVETGIPAGASQSDNHANLIRVSSPLANSTVTSPLIITGTARGTWYFEASFPVVLVDWDGKIIAKGVATAQGDWMTTDFVPFKAELSFNTADISGSYSNKATLVLKKDNPSGLPANDDALEIPIYLK